MECRKYFFRLEDIKIYKKMYKKKPMQFFTCRPVLLIVSNDYGDQLIPRDECGSIS